MIIIISIYRPDYIWNRNEMGRQISRLIVTRVRFPLDIPVPLERFIVRDSFRVTRKARYRRRKERGFDRSSCSLHPRRVNAPATIAARAPTWPASTSVDTSCRKPHLRRYTQDGIQTARRVYIYIYTSTRTSASDRAELDPAGIFACRSPIERDGI